eukprot:m51a1_g11012 putative threonine dehydratase (411) ;mRNA; f:377734-379281
MSLTVEMIHQAAEALKGRIQRTPCILSGALTELTGCSAVYLKLETLQRTSAFKERGALNKLASLTKEERAKGVITASAGNHAQGVAYHARALGIKAVVVMPVCTPTVKVQNVKKFGAQVILHGQVFDEAKEQAIKMAREQGYVMVHPYDDEIVMAGQGTMALEMLADHPDIDTLVLPVGGGGLVSGMGTAAKSIRPDIQVIAVQTERFPWLRCVLKNEPFPAQMGPSTLADGIAVKVPGERTLPVLRKVCDDVVTVSEIEVEKAIMLLTQNARIVAEGAGAVGLAAVLADPARFKGRHVGLVVSGGNIDPLILAEIIERCLVRSVRLSRFSVILNDKPGALSALAGVFGAQGANIVSIEHKRTFTNLPMRSTRVDCVVETQDEEHVKRLMDQLTHDGFSVTDTTAKDVTI